jgi:predicted dehydrogenase
MLSEATEAAVSTGLIGFGKAAETYHLPIIRAVPEIHLKKIVERHGSRSAIHGADLQIVRNHADLLADPDIELVIITTPNESHFDLARQALEAGKHVLVEKPFTVDSADAQRLCDLARDQGRVLSVYHNRRWDSDFLTVKKVIESGVLGELVQLESRFERYRPVPGASWRESAKPGAGLCWEIAPHLVDQALILFGMPEAVWADIRTQRAHGQADDSFDMQLRYGNLRVGLHAGMLIRERGPRFVAHGSQGSFIKNAYDPQETALKAGKGPLGEARWGVEAADDWGRLSGNMASLEFEGRVASCPGDYRSIYRNLARTIRFQETLEVRPEQALNTIRIIELAFESSRQGRVMTVPSQH